MLPQNTRHLDFHAATKSVLPWFSSCLEICVASIFVLPQNSCYLKICVASRFVFPRFPCCTCPSSLSMLKNWIWFFSPSPHVTCENEFSHCVFLFTLSVFVSFTSAIFLISMVKIRSWDQRPYFN
jgi:hypothetical protein